MREILFRGKTETGKWVYGSPVPIKIDSYKTNRIELVRYHGYDELDYYELLSEDDEVIPETVGQYVGLKDRDGTKIFEGDICDMSILGPDHVLTKIVVLNGCVGFIPLDFNAVHPDDRKWRCFWNNDEDDLWPCEYFTVIGNIHDNPELLEVK